MTTDSINGVPVWGTIEAALSTPGTYLGLYGPPGTGKTYAAQHFGLPHTDDGRINRELAMLCNITFNEGTPAAEISGHFVPMGDHFDWHDGHGSRAFRSSWDEKLTHVRLVLNEIDRASDEVLSMVYAIADSPETALLELPNLANDQLTPNPLKLTICATTNLSNPMGDLPEGLADRFSWLPVDTVHPNALLRLDPALRAAAAASITAEEGRRMSIRSWLVFDRMRVAMGNVEQAALVAFGKRFQTVLDALEVAKLTAPIGATVLLWNGGIVNPRFDKRFSSYESFDPEGEHNEYYCGWCRSDTCTTSDDTCKPMRFTNEDEYTAFCGAYDLDMTDDVTPALVVRRMSIRVRTASAELSDGVWTVKGI